MDYRMSLLGSGELPAATLPDPLSLLAEQQGAVVVLDDTSHPEISYSTLCSVSLFWIPIQMQFEHSF
jgi:hypothetical protein